MNMWKYAKHPYPLAITKLKLEWDTTAYSLKCVKLKRSVLPSIDKGIEDWNSHFGQQFGSFLKG